MTTIHSYTNDQVLTDVFHKDLRRARAATQSMIPTKTGAAAAVGLVLPELAGKLDGFAVRVPTINVSLVDLTFTAARDTTVAEVDTIMRDAADGRAQGHPRILEGAARLGGLQPQSGLLDLRCHADAASSDAWSRCAPGTTTSGVSPIRMLDTALALHNAAEDMRCPCCA
jgi:hypothetical protein